MKTYNERIQQNIWVNYLYTFFLRFNISNTFWFLYLLYKGQSLVQVGLLESIYHISSLLLEVPTGMIADLWGRKTSMILGLCAGIIHCILMLTSSSFLGFAMAFFLAAVTNVLNSGAQESLLYDSCLELNKEKEYKRIISNVYFLLLSSSSLALLVGGFVSEIAFEILFVGAIISQMLSIVTTFFFTEPQIAHEDRENKSFVVQIKESIKILKKESRVAYLILFFGVLFSTCTVFYFYCEQYFLEMNLSKSWIGVIFALEGIIGAISSKYAYKVEAKIKEKGLFILGILTVVVNGFALSLISGIVGRSIFFFLIATGASLVEPMFSDYINKLIPSNHRATIISVQSAAFSAVMMLTFPLIGFVADRTSMQVAFRFMVVIFIPMALVCFWKLNGTHKDEKVNAIIE